MNRLQLRNDLMETFLTETFIALSARLGVSYKSLGGKTTADKAASLISKMDRNGRLPELVYRLVQTDPTLLPRYQEYLRIESGPRDVNLEWLDSLAAGEGPAIEEPPTMRWDSSRHPPDPEKDE